jgi:pimeloyl-ACP methyl ester carboxylesterase
MQLVRDGDEVAQLAELHQASLITIRDQFTRELAVVAAIGSRCSPRMPLVTIDNTEIYYEDVGAGPALVFIHGWGTSARAWTAQLADLADDHRVVAFDTRGCGRSGRPARGNTIARNTQDLLDLCAALELDAPVLVGSSMGATYATEAALLAPEAVGAVVAIDGPAYWATQMAEQLDALRDALVRDRAAAVERWVPTWYGPAVGCAIHAWTIRQILDSGPHIDVLFDEIARHDPRPALPSLTVPVAFMHGRLDPEIPLAVAQECAALVPGAQVVVIEDAGHMPHQEQPLAVNAALRQFAAITMEARHAVR